MVKKIKRGEYTDFDKWLSPTDDAVPGQAVAPKKSCKTKRQVCDLQSWLEAWNIYLAIRIQTAPKPELQLVKYQTIVCQLFSAYPAASDLKYDRLFREAAARSKSTTFQWDVLKEDILVWCVTRNPFRARQQMQTTSSTPRQGPAPVAGNASNQEGDSPALARRSVAVLTSESAPRELNGTMPTSAVAQIVVGTISLQHSLVPSWHPAASASANSHTPTKLYR